ncbi:hypothetical protein SAMN05660297_02766 [Natronincola peptidivorans]|uniref:Uncharacterized protein n=1 Tax=Natronincola peptidivorans TaxID=426128 RepID=A0A1I0FF83_9FIRM|nr:hypothetical protein [Natronincola peptidivorans]SET56048.1 hypothetical protein SAMN05660297_02766 [Natronincola peptidivorans]
MYTIGIVSLLKESEDKIMGDLGHCKYCGEVIMLDYSEEATKEEKIKMATKFCKCPQASMEADKNLRLKGQNRE